MKLYYSPGACSLAVHAALIETAADFTVEKVDLKKKESAGRDYLKVNPKGSVPALQITDECILTEVAVVLQYVADQKPEKHLVPRAGTFERYRCLEWLNFISSELHKKFSPLWNREFPEEGKNIFKMDLAKRFAFLVQSLEGKTFLMGEQFTIADCYLFAVLRWSAHLKVDLPAPLMGYVERMKARPSFAETLRREGIN